MHRVFAYGTLMTKTRRNSSLILISTNTFVHVQGFLYNLGWFPGIKLSPHGTSVLCEVMEVSDVELAHLDMYEGYHKESPERSLFVRKLVNVGEIEGFIYEYQGSVDKTKLILSGDWLEFNSDKKVA